MTIISLDTTHSELEKRDTTDQEIEKKGGAALNIKTAHFQMPDGCKPPKRQMMMVAKEIT